jgi:hypothetical protein
VRYLLSKVSKVQGIKLQSFSQRPLSQVHAAAYSGKFTIQSPFMYKVVQVRKLRSVAPPRSAGLRSLLVGSETRGGDVMQSRAP